MPESIEAARERGVDVTLHVARKLAPAMVEDADLVVCMAAEHRDALQRSFPRSRDRVFTLKEVVRLLEAIPSQRPVTPRELPSRVQDAAELRRSGFDGNPYDEDVADPLGLPIESYRAIAWELDEWSARLVDAMFGAAVPAAASSDPSEPPRGEGS